MDETTQNLASDWRVERLASTGSTNDEARRRALDGDAGRLWIIAREQTQGRGRRGRVWTSPPGNLYASALLIDPSPVAIAAQIGFVAGVALRRALDELGAGDEVRLKWPNDLVWRGAKLAGLLVEGVALGDGRLACIVGIGVNCTSAPTGLAYATDHLSNALGRAISAENLFARLAPCFVEALALWRCGAGFAAIRAQWLTHAAGLGGPIRIAGAQGSREGAFETLDEQGRLVLRGANGLEAVEAGDLFLIKEGAGG
ncbi:biotin--[acetyl-CoA-carboxylase] ligase [Methylocapsa sp. S129]|uniref:biotin--[acetyl-CoA-carboxylase] ligase n=1 Tax=Methylocapsa sp. S129 TaxID=1641869 RepID=UPI00131BBB69|nr:biotin--[acetyl-CoA-carboxylase] ligase [Methylocapsa sp. S129]